MAVDARGGNDRAAHVNTARAAQQRVAWVHSSATLRRTRRSRGMGRRFEVQLSAAMAFLSVCVGLVLGACGDTVLVGESCASACEDAHPGAIKSFENVSGLCVCTSCSEACMKSTCGSPYRTPSDACLPCVQEGLRSDRCNKYEGLWRSGCLSDEGCRAFVDCLTACPAK